MHRGIDIGRPPLLALMASFVGGALAGLVGLIFQPLVTILLAVGGVAASSAMCCQAPGPAPRQAYMLGAWAGGMVVTLVVLLVPLAVAR